MTFLCRIKHVSLRPHTRLYSITSIRPIDQLEHDGARILRVVQKRVEERAKLLTQMSEDTSSPGDFKLARQAKELDPLKAAWDQWETNRQVRIGLWINILIDGC